MMKNAKSSIKNFRYDVKHLPQILNWYKTFSKIPISNIEILAINSPNLPRGFQGHSYSFDENMLDLKKSEKIAVDNLRNKLLNLLPEDLGHASVILLNIDNRWAEFLMVAYGEKLLCLFADHSSVHMSSILRDVLHGDEFKEGVCKFARDNTILQYGQSIEIRDYSAQIKIKGISIPAQMVLLILDDFVTNPCNPSFDYDISKPHSDLLQLIHYQMLSFPKDMNEREIEIIKEITMNLAENFEHLRVVAKVFEHVINCQDYPENLKNVLDSLMSPELIQIAGSWIERLETAKLPMKARGYTELHIVDNSDSQPNDVENSDWEAIDPLKEGEVTTNKIGDSSG